jgi:hypothetical protein
MATSTKRPPAKKAAVKKAATKKAPARKAPARKAAAEKVAAKKAVVKKAPAKSAPATLDDDAAVAKEFRRVVNMTGDALDRWLATKESRVVGAKNGVTGTAEGGPESVGHRSGRRIIGLLAKDTYTTGDYAHMRKVIGYVRRHLAQRPASEDIGTSRWRYSLMNWGHDPLHERKGRQ